MAPKDQRIKKKKQIKPTSYTFPLLPVLRTKEFREVYGWNLNYNSVQSEPGAYPVFIYHLPPYQPVLFQWAQVWSASKQCETICVLLAPFSDIEQGWLFGTISYSLRELATMTCHGTLHLGSVSPCAEMLEWSQLPSKVLWSLSSKLSPPLATGTVFDCMDRGRACFIIFNMVITNGS